ncbi:YlxR family protein [Cyanobium sp. HWJ4-Hawea]|uniref:YlxR family protein n=1 Tax=unclassified Cyanobium TaxID=2627006 RepID=UPI0020CBBB31|nr:MULTISPECIES: YlxR family protein [unclassified Cyanobium]MCP9775270.1 YlxR family protein [Cyanobium sp. WAJ14-Wanaka]MCP9809800.1 YlxR family protein [Cyanobium sp. HWJ4-Hawea]
MSSRPVLRRCVSCRELLDRQQLWRIIRLAEGGIGLDQGMGRSAYLCPNQECFEEAKRRKRLQRALRCQVAETIVETLEQRLNTSVDRASKAI